MDDISRRLYSAAQVRELDRRAMVSGISGYALMQQAAATCWSEITQRWPHVRRIQVLCGAGNNGGDGFEIANLARAAGCEVQVWQVGKAAVAGDALRARQAWRDAGGTITLWTGQTFTAADLIVDAVFGIGLNREVSDEIKQLIEVIRASRASGAKVLAVDLPSGLDADTGKVWGAAVDADVTVTFIGRKLGLHTGAGPAYAGQVVFKSLDVAPAAHADQIPLARMLDIQQLRTWLPPRMRTAHKGSHGHVLIVGGDEGMMGAALLAAVAALRAGAGLVSVATRTAHAAAMTAAQPELMCRGAESARELTPLIERASVVVIGPGLGQSPWGREMFACVLEHEKPLVVDADALNLLAQEPVRRDDWVLTPHPGEAARLLGIANAQVQNDRISAAHQLRQKLGGVNVLKGAGTLVQGEQLVLCPYGNPGMAIGGMGDVLSGIIAACIAQGLSPEVAARAGVLAHAVAGDKAALQGERGLLPSDLLQHLRTAVNP